jgi:hypothetical protein
VVPQYERCPHRGQALTSDELKLSALHSRGRKLTPEEIRTFEKTLIEQRGVAKPKPVDIVSQ